MFQNNAAGYEGILHILKDNACKTNTVSFLFNAAKTWRRFSRSISKPMLRPFGFIAWFYNIKITQLQLCKEVWT